MAFVVHPTTGKVVEAQKKGMSKNGEKQYWLDKSTKKRFTTDAGAENYVDQKTKKILKTPSKPTKKAVAKKAAPKRAAGAANGSKKTIIKVNGNEIKSKKGILSNDEAFDLVSDYFRELTKTNVTRKNVKDGVEIAFQVKTGRKG